MPIPDHPGSSLVIVRKFDIDGSFVCPDEADAELIVDADRMLPGPIAFQLFQMIARWHFQIAQRNRGIQITELAADNPDQVRRKAVARDTVKSVLGLAVAEAP